jgi:hypothetical protein
MKLTTRARVRNSTARPAANAFSCRAVPHLHRFASKFPPGYFCGRKNASVAAGTLTPSYRYAISIKLVGNRLPGTFVGRFHTARTAWPMPNLLVARRSSKLAAAATKPLPTTDTAELFTPSGFSIPLMRSGSGRQTSTNYSVSRAEAKPPTRITNSLALPASEGESRQTQPIALRRGDGP